MTTYRTSEVAKIIGLHPNTIRKYEVWELIPKPKREANGYRIYTDFHIDLIKLSRKAFQIELLHANLRRTMIALIKAAAKKDFPQAFAKLALYQQIVAAELEKAQKAAEISGQLLAHKAFPPVTRNYSRKAVAELLGLTVDSLRNWELNGLLHPKRRANGQRFYTDQELQLIQVIQTLRDAKYSLEAILRMLNEAAENPEIVIVETLNQPNQEAEIISVCDQLITSLKQGMQNAQEIHGLLEELAEHYS